MATIPVDTSGIVDSSGIDAADVLTPIGDLKDAIEETLEGGHNFEKIGLAAPVQVTISSGVITISQHRHKIETEGSASTDILETITGTHPFVVLSLNSSGQAITIKHNTGNIFFENQRDFVLTNQSYAVVLWWNAVSSKWVGVNQMWGDISLADGVNTSISGDTISLTRTKVRLVSETGNIDNLATVTNTASLDMAVLMAAAGHSIIVKHNVGNIYFPKGTEYVLSNDDLVLLVWNDIVSKWVAVGMDYLPPAAQTLERVEDVRGTGGTFDKLIFPPNLIRLLGSNDVAIDAQSRFGSRRIAYDQLVTGTTFSSFGGTFANFGNAPSAYAADSAYADYVTSGVNNNSAGRRSNAIAQIRWNPLFEAVVAFQAAPANTPGVLIGLATGTPTVSGYTGVSGVFLDYFYGASKWRLLVYNNGTQLASSQIATSPAMTTGARFRIRIWVDYAANVVSASVNDGAPLTTGALALSGWSTIGLDMVAAAIANTGASSIAVSRMYLEQD